MIQSSKNIIVKLCAMQQKHNKFRQKIADRFFSFFLLLGNKYAAAKREIMDLASIFTPRLFGRNSGFYTGLFDQNLFHSTTIKHLRVSQVAKEGEKFKKLDFFNHKRGCFCNNFQSKLYIFPIATSNDQVNLKGNLGKTPSNYCVNLKEISGKTPSVVLLP